MSGFDGDGFDEDSNCSDKTQAAIVPTKVMSIFQSGNSFDEDGNRLA
jgi:hypothetical protein